MGHAIFFPIALVVSRSVCAVPEGVTLLVAVDEVEHLPERERHPNSEDKTAASAPVLLLLFVDVLSSG